MSSQVEAKPWTTFMDRAEQDSQSWIRETLFDNHVFCNNTFRSAYDHVARFALNEAREHGLNHIVELGAGTAPLTSRMAALEQSEGLRFTACDRNPQPEQYEKLETKYPHVSTIKTSVNYAEPRSWEPGTMLVILGSFPALPESVRLTALANLTQSADRVMVWEFVRKTPRSMFLASLTFFVALVLPLAWIHKPGALRRVLWCWLIPVIPFIVVYDGVAWCLRAWTDRQWSAALKQVLPPGRSFSIESTSNTQLVTW